MVWDLRSSRDGDLVGMLESKEFEVPLKGHYLFRVMPNYWSNDRHQPTYLSGCWLFKNSLSFFFFSFFSISHGEISSYSGVKFMINMSQGVRSASLKGWYYPGLESTANVTEGRKGSSGVGPIAGKSGSGPEFVLWRRTMENIHSFLWSVCEFFGSLLIYLFIFLFFFIFFFFTFWSNKWIIVNTCWGWPINGFSLSLLDAWLIFCALRIDMSSNWSIRNT